jgi:hypothetical protein
MAITAISLLRWGHLRRTSAKAPVCSQTSFLNARFGDKLKDYAEPHGLAAASATSSGIGLRVIVISCAGLGGMGSVSTGSSHAINRRASQFLEPWANPILKPVCRPRRAGHQLRRHQPARAAVVGC